MVPFTQLVVSSHMEPITTTPWHAGPCGNVGPHATRGSFLRLSQGCIGAPCCSVFRFAYTQWLPGSQASDSQCTSSCRVQCCSVFTTGWRGWCCSRLSSSCLSRASQATMDSPGSSLCHKASPNRAGNHPSPADRHQDTCMNLRAGAMPQRSQSCPMSQHQSLMPATAMAAALSSGAPCLPLPNPSACYARAKPQRSWSWPMSDMLYRLLHCHHGPPSDSSTPAPAVQAPPLGGAGAAHANVLATGASAAALLRIRLLPALRPSACCAGAMPRRSQSCPLRWPRRLATSAFWDPLPAPWLPWATRSAARYWPRLPTCPPSPGRARGCRWTTAPVGGRSPPMCTSRCVACGFTAPIWGGISGDVYEQVSEVGLGFRAL